MDSSAPRVSAIVLNRNNASDTIACLASLSKSDYAALDILVVDNGSDDGSDVAIERAFSNVRLLRARSNLGFAAGMNRGIAQAVRSDAKFVLLLNNDTVVAPDCISHLVRTAVSRPKAGICVPKILFQHLPNIIWSAGAMWKRWPPRVKLIGLGRPDGPDFDQPMDLEYATGCSLLIRLETIAQVGLLDERYFMYQEDYDYCYRCRSAGWSIRYVPGSRVWHKVSAGLGIASQRWWYHWSRSTLRLYRSTWRYSWAALPAVFCRSNWQSLCSDCSDILLSEEHYKASFQYRTGVSFPLVCGTVL